LGSDERPTSASPAVSTLIGIAIDQGLIGGVDDPVTDYVPELEKRGPRFERITLGDLLSMRSGLRYEESSFPVPWGDDTYTYYGVDLRKEALERTEVEQRDLAGDLPRGRRPGRGRIPRRSEQSAVEERGDAPLVLGGVLVDGIGVVRGGQVPVLDRPARGRLVEQHVGVALDARAGRDEQ
jgi:beta-lactamase family protein